MIGPALGLPTLAFRMLEFWVIGFGSIGLFVRLYKEYGLVNKEALVRPWP
jgi:hypothetical protein